MGMKIVKTKLNDFLVGSNTALRLSNNPTYQVINTPLHRTSGGKGNYFAGPRMNGDDVYVYHAEKQRARFKKEVILFKSGPNKGQIKTKKVTKIKLGGWKIRVFRFPAERVLSVKQHARHFDIVLK